MLYFIALLVIVGLLNIQQLFKQVGNLRATVDDLKQRQAALEARFGDEASVIRHDGDLAAAVPGAQKAIETSPPLPDATPRPTPTGKPSLAAIRNWEKTLAEHWLVWLGGITLALGGAFFVKVSIDQGLLTPTIRVFLGVLFGIGLTVAGDRVGRRDRLPDESSASYVPQALTAAGLATVFASLYAAYQLYGLLPGWMCFALLGTTAAAAVLLSVRQGPLVAALGLTGAFVVPLLVRSDQPQAIVLFSYLAVVVVASLVLVRHKGWPWLAWLTLASGLGWSLLWLSGAHNGDGSLAVGCFLLAMLASFAVFRRGLSAIPPLSGVDASPITRAVVRVAFWAVTLGFLVLAHADHYGATGLGCALAAVLFLLWFGHRDPEFDDVIAAAGLLPLAVLVTWALPIPDLMPSRVVLPLVPPELVSRFVTGAGVAALILGGGGFLGMVGAPRPGRWATLSAAAPLSVLIVAYWRLQPFALDIAWSSTALLLAALSCVAAERVAAMRHRGPHWDAALAAYAVGVLGATILAATIALEQAWLTVALAVHLPALGWIEHRLKLPALRHVAVGVATAVLVRLVANPFILDYPMASTPVFNWLLYGYGLPTAAFLVATHQFGRNANDLLVALLEAGSIAFLSLLVTLELRQALSDGKLVLDLSDLARDSVETIAWLGMASVFLHLGRVRDRRVLIWGGSTLFWLASVQAVLWQALWANPVYTGAPVGLGLWPPADALTIAYGCPGLLFLLIAVCRLGPGSVWRTARCLTVAFVFGWLTLEVRHVFQGEVLSGSTTTESEWYVYSAVWLVLAGVNLTIGLMWNSPWLRKLALAGIGLVVLKVFLSDTTDLTGVWRALSFLGLGGTLIAVGYGYRHLKTVQRPTSHAAAPTGQGE